MAGGWWALDELLNELHVPSIPNHSIVLWFHMKHWTNVSDSYIHSVSTKRKKVCAEETKEMFTQALVSALVHILFWWVCLQVVPMASAFTQTAGASSASWHLHTLGRAELGPVAQTDELWQQRDFFSRPWAMGNVAQVLQNENMWLSENENRDMMVAIRKREAQEAELL